MFKSGAVTFENIGYGFVNIINISFFVSCIWLGRLLYDLFRQLNTRLLKQIFHYIKYSLCYAKASNEFAESISESLRPNNTQLLSKKCRSGGEPGATLCPIWPARDLNLRPPTQKNLVTSRPTGRLYALVLLHMYSLSPDTVRLLKLDDPHTFHCDKYCERVWEESAPA